LLGIRDFLIGLLASITERSPVAGIHARLSNVHSLCRHDVGENPSLLQSRCGTRLLDLRICRFERRLILRELLLHSGVVKFNQ